MTSKIFRKLLASMLVLLGLALSLAAQAQNEIPIETLFRKSEYRSLSFSPDQKFMAALMPVNSRYNLVVLDLDKRTANRVTAFTDADVLSYSWASNDRILFSTGNEQDLTSPAGDGGLFGVDRSGERYQVLVKPFVRANGAQLVGRITTVLGRLKDSKDEVMVAANDRSADSTDLYRMNMFTGRKSLLTFDSPGKVVRWVVDSNNVPRAAFQQDFKTGSSAFVYRSSATSPFKVLRKWDYNLSEVVIPIRMDPAANTMIVASNIGRDTMAFFRFDPETNTMGELIYGDDRYDMYSLYLIGGGLGEGGQLRYGGSEEEPGKVIGVTYQADRLKTFWFDEAIRKEQELLDGALPKGYYNGWNPNERRTLVWSRADVDPGRYYVFDRDKKTVEDTGIRPAPWLDPKQLNPMRYVTWTAADGMKIGGYLTLPKSYSPGNPVPMVLHPHGGPWAKDNWGFDRNVQFLANRGFAVLQPNFRGSTGYGTKHLKASYKQWGDAMIGDMISGVEWAIKEGFADKNRLGVYGASYGGYATLMAMATRPDLFKWGVNYVGVTDMFVHQDTQPAQKLGDFGLVASIINGDQKTDREMFLRTSPTLLVNKFQAPVFHAYGGEDRNVDIANGRAIRAAFDRANKAQEWMYVDDEAHGYRLDKNVFEFYRRMDAFIKKHTPTK